MSAAQAAYDRLIAAQRVVTAEERFETEEQTKREKLALRIKRRLPKVF